MLGATLAVLIFCGGIVFAVVRGGLVGDAWEQLTGTNFVDSAEVGDCLPDVEAHPNDARFVPCEDSEARYQVLEIRTDRTWGEHQSACEGVLSQSTPPSLAHLWHVASPQQRTLMAKARVCQRAVRHSAW